MDLSKLANYELLYPLDIVWQDKPTGLKMMIRSSSSEAVKQVTREHSRKNVVRIQKGKTLAADRIEENAVERAAACIASWEWTGDATYNGEKPALSMKVATEMLSKWDWIYDQVVEAANNLDFFSAGSAKPSAGG